MFRMDISRNNNTLNGNNVESTIAARIEQKQKDNIQGGW